MDNNKMHILWTNDNVDTAKLMVLLYATVSMKNKFWDEMTVIIWGAPSKLVAKNKEIQQLITEAQKEGVEFVACQHCAEQLGVREKLEDLGVAVSLWGRALTELIKNKENLLSI